MLEAVVTRIEYGSSAGRDHEHLTRFSYAAPKVETELDTATIS